MLTALHALKYWRHLNLTKWAPQGICHIPWAVFEFLHCGNTPSSAGEPVCAGATEKHAGTTGVFDWCPRHIPVAVRSMLFIWTKVVLMWLIIVRPPVICPQSTHYRAFKLVKEKSIWNTSSRKVFAQKSSNIKSKAMSKPFLKDSWEFFLTYENFARVAWPLSICNINKGMYPWKPKWQSASRHHYCSMFAFFFCMLISDFVWPLSTLNTCRIY